MSDRDTQDIVNFLIEQSRDRIVEDMAKHVGDRVHEIIKAQAMLMPTSAMAVAMAVLAARQILDEAVGFAANCMDGDEADAEAMRRATLALFDELKTTPETLTKVPLS